MGTVGGERLQLNVREHETLQAAAMRRFYLFNRPGFFAGQLVFQAYPIVLTAAGATILLAVIYVMFVAKFVRQIIWSGLILV